MVPVRKIADVLVKIQKALGVTIGPDRIAIYIEHLQNMEESDFQAAAVRLMSEFRPTSTVPFPLIRDFLEMAGQDGKTKAVNVVATLRKDMERLGQYQNYHPNDRALTNVIMRYGGWVDMVNNNTDEWWSLHERNFITAYEAAKRSGFEGPVFVKGLHRIENEHNGVTAEKIAKQGVDPMVCGYDETPAIKGRGRQQGLSSRQNQSQPQSLKYSRMSLREKLMALPSAPVADEAGQVSKEEWDKL